MKLLITIYLTFGLTLVMVAGGCRSQSSAIDKTRMPTADSPYVKVYVTKSGEIILDGKTATIDELEASLAALAERHGVVLYTREAPEEKEPHPTARKVLDVVVKNRLPIRLCLKHLTVNSGWKNNLTPRSTEARGS